MSSVNLKDSPAIKDYSLLEIVGTGSYSIVYRARQKQVVVNSQFQYFFLILPLSECSTELYFMFY